MPDRVTNTIHVLTNGKEDVVMRPTVINCYEGHLNSVADWWPQWLNFYFKTTVHVKKGACALAASAQLTSCCS